MKINLTVLAAIICFASADAQAVDKPKLPEGPGREMTEKLCGSCHGVGLFVNRRESRESWNGIIEDMIRRGMKGEDEEYGEVSDYLAVHLSKSSPAPKLKVNEVTLKAIASALAISEEQAAAVVKYRVANGKFQGMEDLLKVPGIDAKAIEAKKDKIEF